MNSLRERKKLRLEGYDYASPGAYFVTLCVQGRLCVLGAVEDGAMQLNPYGEIVHQQWEWLHRQYAYLTLDACAVMPNHFHAVLSVGTGRDLSLGPDRDAYVGDGRDRPLQPVKIKPVSELIGAFKTTSSKLIHLAGESSFQWQRSYYDHIIRTPAARKRISRYIRNNPQQWVSDIEFVSSSENTAYVSTQQREDYYKSLFQETA